MTSTALATTTATPALLAFEPASLPEALQLANTLFESGMFPKMRSAAAVFAIIATGRELGMPAMQSLRSLHSYDGKITMSSDLIMALVRRSSLCKRLTLVESTPERCTYETLREGQEKPVALTWTIKDAERAGLTKKDNWVKFPRDMLRARCGTALCRAEYPEVTMGLYDGDELNQPQTPGQVPVVAEVIVQQDVPVQQAAPKSANIPDAVLVNESSVILSMYAGKLAACQTMQEIDRVSTEAGNEELEGPARSKMVALFREHRERVTGGTFNGGK